MRYGVRVVRTMCTQGKHMNEFLDTIRLLEPKTVQRLCPDGHLSLEKLAQWITEYWNEPWIPGYEPVLKQLIVMGFKYLQGEMK